MNEASVSAPFMKLLRLALPGALVIKHRDASMIGLPDCSITWNKTIAWLEFKLWTPPKHWNRELPPIEKIVASSPVQRQMMRALSAQAHLAAYVIWVKKSRMVILWDQGSFLSVWESGNEAALWLAKWLVEGHQPLMINYDSPLR